jgi:hypothetical protein
MMRTLSAAGILEVWERGSSQTPAERALTLLAATHPELPEDALAELPLGARDGRLLTARAELFGETLASFARCPACGEALEFTAQVADLRTGPPDDESPGAAGQAFRATLHPVGPDGPAAHLTYRLPSGGDLIALQDVTEPAAFRVALAERCVSAATWGGATVAPGDLSDDVLTALAAEMSVLDPQAEVLLDLTCPVCGARWQTVFDIATYFWAELAAEAKRLLREVDALARAYGWREADILALSPKRRQAYLELVWTS